MSSFVVLNPASGEVEAEYPASTDDMVEQALASAASCYDSWRRVPVAERTTALRRVAELIEQRKTELASAVSREMGKRLVDALGELDICINIATYYADHAEELLADTPMTVSAGGSAVVRKSPTGPLLGIMPWNYPYYQVFRFAAPNLVAGNVVLIKHASQCPESAANIEKLFEDAGFPAGAYVNLFATHDQLEEIIADDRVVGVSLTGSERAGSHVASLAGRHLKKIVLELGGSDPYLILATDDMDETVTHATKARLSNGGQSCNAGKRFIVADDLYDDFVEKFAAAFAAQTPGDPFDEQSSYGPMSSAGAVEELDAQVRDALSHGARAIVGGERSASHPGCYEATILVDVPASARAFREELFGPVAVVHRVRDNEEAVRMANDTPFGLGAAVFHTDTDIAMEIADRLDAGMVFINARESGGADMPFGGTKRSGFGRELGPEGIDEFINKKLIHTAD